MASKAQIKQHLAMSTTVKLAITSPAKSDEARKIRTMEHVQKSKGASA
ncbi:MAG: hypothetical protein AAF921_15120 [Cyanobacteria bacterium P01_D01_bin.44]